MFKTYLKTKKNPIRNEKNFSSFQFLLLLFIFYYVPHMPILLSLVFVSSFQFLQVLLLFSEKCKTTTSGVHPPIFHGQLITFHLTAIFFFLQQETKKNAWHYCNEKEKVPLKLIAGGTLISFFRTELSKCCWLGSHLPSSF